MTEPRIESFEAFWPFYLGEHRNPVGRALHYCGTAMGTLTFIAAAVTFKLWLVPVALILGYGPAWVAHFFIENNQPATFKYPHWSLQADYKMLWLAMRGKMGDEMVRLYGSAAPAPDAPLRVQR